MSLSKEECHELFVFFNNKENAAVSQMSRQELESVKEQMEASEKESFKKLVSLFKDVEELILAKIFCQNRGNLADTSLDVKMYL